MAGFNFKNKFSDLSSVGKGVGMDIGTANTVIYIEEKGIVLSEPTVVAVDTRTDEVIAVGKDAKEMVGKTNDNIELVYPVERGAVSNEGALSAMLKIFLKKVGSKHLIGKPKVFVAVPSGITEVERHAMEDVIKSVGVTSVHLMEAPMAGAIGAKLPVGSPRGTMIISLGAGVSECAFLSLGDVVSSGSVRIGSQDFDKSIMSYIKRKYSLHIGVNTAQDIKEKIGSVYTTQESVAGLIEVRGRSVIDNIPKSVTLRADEIEELLSSEFRPITKMILDTLAETPPEIISDIMTFSGNVIGGGAAIKGLKELMYEETGIKIIVEENSSDCVALGLGESLNLVFSVREMRKSRRIK